MVPCFPPSYYWDDGVFAREQSMFESLWTFAGFARDLTEIDSYIALEIGQKSVFVQNFSGELRAFENVCSHRFSRLRLCPKGKGAVQCPYHGWGYNAEGIPDVIPKKPRFEGLTPEVRQSLALHRWQVATCGSLVFVRSGHAGPTLFEFLGSSFDVIAAMSSAFGSLLDENTMELAANWKVVVENTLEGYHVSQIHAETFEKLNFRNITMRTEGLQTAWLGDLGEDYTKKTARVNGLFVSRPLQISGYEHWLLFPNVTLATTFGTSFALQTIVPLSATRTKFTSYVFGTKLTEELTPSKKNLVQALYDQIVQFNRKVFEEDRAIIEWVQRGTAQTQQRGILSEDELRVFHFQRDYLAMLESCRTSSTEIS
jgi:phenylpropionate dioxygenase-like ring-hydroxylating dioxygenase large terminal subunit